MGKQKDAILILGEGPTEFYYFNSLKDEFPFLQNIEPKTPKHSSINELQKRIEQAVMEGYSRVYCVIDMNNKKEGKEKDNYKKLKDEYLNPIIKPKDGINCEVKFFETERCTELFFLYYFKYTTKEFSCSDVVTNELNKECDYEKSLKFFARHPLHQHFEKNGGTLVTAIKNAEKSCQSALETARDHTYSQLGDMIKGLLKQQNIQENENK